MSQWTFKHQMDIKRMCFYNTIFKFKIKTLFKKSFFLSSNVSEQLGGHATKIYTADVLPDQDRWYDATCCLATGYSIQAFLAGRNKETVEDKVFRDTRNCNICFQLELLLYVHLKPWRCVQVTLPYSEQTVSKPSLSILY